MHKSIPCHLQVAVRMSPREHADGVARLRSRRFAFAEAFPRCADACAGRERRWISYKRGVLKLCQGVGGRERGVPPPGGEVARLALRASSLQELFCAAEAIGWPGQGGSSSG